MKKYISWLPAALGLLAATPALAQNELSNFSATGRGGVVNTFATDYQALGINPANLGRQSTSLVAFTVGEVGAGVGSQSLTNSQLKQLIFHPNATLPAAERTALVANLNSPNALNINVDATALGLAFTLPPGLGSVAVSMHQRLSGHLALNQNSADLMVNGQNAALVQQYYDAAGNPRRGTTPPLLSAALDGTAMQLALTNEFNIGYGVEVLDVPGVLTVTAGAGYRYLQGVGIADVRSSGGSLSAYSSLSPIFSINYGTLAGNSNFNYQNGSGLQPVGHGNGFDLGLAAEVGKVVRLGVSVTDLGSMTWTGNVLTATDQNLAYPQYSGLTTYNVVQNVVNQFGDAGQTLLTYQTAQERRADLPTKLRLGGGVRISELFEAGLDVTVPLNQVAGNLPTPFVGAGLDFKPVRWVRLSTGVSGGAGYNVSLPLGITFVTPVWEAGLSTRSVLGYFSENNPYASVALGFLRFRVGKS
ncbi:hypothetical protein E4631_10800 [Hymenobacter sp. UV11]|uniref:DUF5723 family protein n=1 Tax=Hymenobacter sp. UV11 TaxID=1849735 RepID=UPI001060A7A0|nr:DUF5723 family protein [Hymenobacter sp. UV11]TDN40489.1 hypothetical protein A8B98_13750 [Hymenobacter sp. UV11]TFZ66497.1 hypothetical protein E4631_10800 [Hymenobacter sp. UV11]